MFSCLGRLGCLFLLLIGGVVAFLTRDRWMSRLTERTAQPPQWEVVSDPGAKQAGAALEDLKRPNGPAYVNVSAAELASLMVQTAAEHGLPATLDSVKAAVEEDKVRVRALVKLEDVRGLDALGPLATMLDKQEPIEFTGTLSVIRPGLGEFRVVSVKVAELLLPKSAIPRLLARLDRKARPEGIAPDGIAITIPEYIGDVRVARGQVTVYRRTP